MELRDHFAGLAMQAMMDMYREMYEQHNIFEGWVEDAMPSLAMQAYEMADFMLIAREKRRTFASNRGTEIIFGEGDE